MKILGKIYLVFCWVLLIFVIISKPMAVLANPQAGTSLSDKGLHFILFGVLA